MIVWPAVDILGGRAVRLERGEFGTETVYDQDPLDAAKRWVAEGARALHVVDLDGARTGAPANLHHVERIAAASEVPIQLGGGLRTAAAVDQALGAGVDRVVIGTLAYKDPETLSSLIAAHGERLVVSLDTRHGRLAAAGWLELTELTPQQLLKRLENHGVANFIYSSIDRDGMLEGPELEGIAAIAPLTRARLIYSGGVASLKDLEALARITPPLDGVIAGKALYERRFTLAEAQSALSKCTTSA